MTISPANTDTTSTGKPLTGRTVALVFCAAFSVIIAVNLTLAFQAVATFPGLEVKNSYVASQSFDANRKAQRALGWHAKAWLTETHLHLHIDQAGQPAQATIRSALLGRATHVADDQSLTLTFDGTDYVAPLTHKLTSGAQGNWNLRLTAEAPDGTVFRQRIILDRQP